MEILIIGAGYAGLVAAFSLHKNGHTVRVLEARPRVGGRALEYFKDGVPVCELGGQYLAPEQTRVHALLQELGLKTFPAWSSGSSFVSLNRQTGWYTTDLLDCFVKQLGQPTLVKREIEAVLAQLSALYQKVSATTPWLSEHAHAWDAITFQSWLDDSLQTAVAKDFFRFMVNQGFSTEPSEISLLQMLWFLKTSHGLPAWAIGGSQASRVVGGTQLVAERIAEVLGERVLANQPVVSIMQHDARVTVVTYDQTYHADAVIVCVPPQLSNTIVYDPILPADLFRAFAALQGGNAMKVQAIYQEPFWRAQGRSGNGILFDGPQTFTFDNSGPAGMPGVLLGFVTGNRATALSRKPFAERKQVVLQAWADVLGPEAHNVIDYVEMDWAQEQFTRGGHGCHFPPGAWSELGVALGANRLPSFGRIIWAASDVAKDWNGYLEGAVFAGQQAAEEVVQLVK